MKCISCGAGSSFGTTTDVTDLGSCLVIVRNVPCHKCSECDEIMYTGEVVKKLENITAVAKVSMNELTVVDFSVKVA